MPQVAAIFNHSAKSNERGPMPLNVTITQGFATNEHVMDVLTTNTEALLKMMLDGVAVAGAGPRRGTVAVQDTDFPGMKVEVVGVGLTYDTAGHLTASRCLGPQGR